jgi:Cyclic nucleotide-binding domain
MRIERTITTVSWIPSDSLSGLLKAPEVMRVAHHDQPPPDQLGSVPDETLEKLKADDSYRFANRLRAWIEVEDGRIVDAGYAAGGLMGSSTVKLGVGEMTVAGVAYDDQQAEPEHGDGWVRFRQTTGGRTGLPIPRPVRKAPFFQFRSPAVWTTLEMTIRADGSHEARLAGASEFPRHWVYDDEGALVSKSGLTDLKTWLGTSFGNRTPWGDYDNEVLVTAVESALERELSTHLMRGSDHKPDVIKLREGDVLVEQGQESTAMFLVLDGVLTVEVDGAEVAELGPGAVVGERAGLEGGKRTATLRCTTPCRVAVASASGLDRQRLSALAEGHRREENERADEPEQ